MNHDNRFSPYPQQQRQNMPAGSGNQFQGYNNNNNVNNQPPIRRNDFGGGGGRRGGGGGGPLRENRYGGGGGRNDRFNDRGGGNRRNAPNRGNYDDQGYGGFQDNYDTSNMRPAVPERERRPNNREKPCRTLFVRNVQYNITEDEVKALFAKFGTIKDVFNLIENRGMIFVTFYDVRAAEDAKNEMQGYVLSDRKIDVHYSLPKEEEEKARCDRTKNQGTLLYTLKQTDAELDDGELHEYFKGFGEVKAIRVPHFKKTPAVNPSHYERNQQRLVEFYDSRACVEAYDNTYEHEYKGGRWDVAFFWDHPYKDRAIAHQRRERNYDRDRSPPRRRRESDYNQYPNDAPVKNEWPNIKQEWPASSSAQAQAPLSVGGGGYANQQAVGQPIPHQQVDPRLYANAQQQQQQAMMGTTTPQLESAQKAQQLLSSILASTSGSSGQGAQVGQQQSQTSSYQQNTPSVTSPNVPPSQPHLLQQPFVQPVPPTEDSQTNIHQLLGLLAATQQAQQQAQVQQQQQQRQQQQQQQPVQYQQSPVGQVQQVQSQPQPQAQQYQPSAPFPTSISNSQQQGGMPDVGTVNVLSQLAALLGGQQGQSNSSPLPPPPSNQ